MTDTKSKNDSITTTTFPKPLILHFDINGTITSHDSTEKGSDEQLANMLLSRSTYGKVFKGDWIMNEKNYFEEGKYSVSYYNYLKHMHSNYKELSYIFTEEKHPGHKLNGQCKDIMKTNKSLLFPSFLNVLDKYPFAKIVFLTFGNDKDLIMKELKKYNYCRKFLYGEFVRVMDVSFL